MLLAHSHGEPVLALAAIIQHSPLVLLARQDGQLTALRDLRGKRLHVVEHEYELFAMFQALGFSRQDFQLLTRSVDLGPLSVQVLCEVARRLLKHVRQSDTVARMGGDEFTVILNHLHSDDNGEMIVRQILKTIAQPYHLQGREARLGASIGVSLYPDHATDSEQLLKLADSAMYQVKHGGKNAYAYSR